MELSTPSINDDIINKNCVFPSNIKKYIVFDEMAPVFWERDDIINSILHQKSDEYINNIRMSLESIIAFIQKNDKRDIYSKELSIKFYSYHHYLIGIIPFGDKNSISSAMTMLINTFLDICYEDVHLLTMDMLLTAIMDLSLVALSIKKSYKKKDMVTFGQSSQAINVIELFFVVVEMIYKYELEEVASQVREVAYPSLTFKKQLIRFSSDANISKFAKQIIIPFQSYLSENDKASKKNKSIQNHIPKSIHSSILFAYLAIFPIVEVSNISYCSFSSHKRLMDRTLPYREFSKITYSLFRFILVLNKYNLFLSDFAAASRSFVNISWFLHILKSYHVDISFFEDVVLKTFSNEVVNTINVKKDSDNLHEKLDDLLQLYSLSTDRTDIREKMKSIYALCLLKAN